MTALKGKVRIDVDLGEGYGNYRCAPDEELLPFIDYANIACGFHAGDPSIMQSTVQACKQASVTVGAHPGFPDIQGFGRRQMKLSLEEHTANIVYQIGALTGFLEAEGMDLNHVKPHGSLYNMSYRDQDLCRALYKGIKFFKNVKVFGLANSWHEKVAAEMNIQFVAVINADLDYDSDGKTIIEQKKSPWTRDKVIKHVHQQLFDGSVMAISGETIPINLEGREVSLCCHSDSPGCVEIVNAARTVVDDYNSKTII